VQPDGGGRSGDDLETRTRIQSLQRLARRARSMTADVRVIEDDLQQLASEHVPELLAERCVGTVKRSGFSGGWVLPRSDLLGLVGERSNAARTPPAACCRSWSAGAGC
jgi:hypothetical protein